jgi:hypothetical protein
MPKSAFNTKDIKTPQSGLVVLRDAYWLCEDGDPKRALFFGDSPQCNKDKRITEYLLNTAQYKYKGNLLVTFVELAFVPPRD